MLNLPESVQLLHRVARRLQALSFFRRLYLLILALCCLYAVVLLASRLSGLFSVELTPTTIGFIPLVAVFLAAILHRRPTLVDAARTIDKQSGSKDLFLTVALLEKSAGSYQSLVAHDAEEAAPKVEPADVVPFGVGRRFADVAIAMLAIWIGVQFVPQLDPFGRVEAAEEAAAMKEDLQTSRKATQARTAQLQKDDSGGEESPEVKKAVEDLKSAFRKMKPQAKKSNFQALASRQKSMGALWRQRNAEQLKELLSKSPSMQRFGGASKSKLDQWTRELQEGGTKGLEKEFSELQEDLREMLKTTDPVKRAELAQKVNQKLSDLEEFAKDRVNSKPLAAALERAKKQLGMSKLSELSQESLKGLEESLELAQLELKEISQTAKDLQALEEALKTIQLAKRANDQDQLDGEQCENCVSMADYAELFAELGGYEGEGEGTGGEDGGGGATVEEDDSVETDFQSEHTKTALNAGKVLLSLKTKGLSDTGDAKKEYSNLIQNVRQGVSEAILQEQIPPGYHDGIRQYFDNMESSTREEPDESAQ